MMPAMPKELHVCADYESMSRFAAELFVQQALAASESNRRFSVCLSGGGTPRRAYELLSRDPYRSSVDWSNIHVFWGDERCVPRDDDRNNAKMATQTWLGVTPIPPQQIHAIDGTGDPHHGADTYERALREYFGSKTPRFDLVFLGLGDNGHTASLFPESPVLDETQRWVADTFVSDQGMHRITLTAPILNQAVLTVFLVSGQSKAEVLRDVLEGPFKPFQLPAQLIRPQDGRLLWLVDRPASAKLGGEWTSETPDDQ